LAGFSSHVKCLIVAALGEPRLAMALVNLPEHYQWHGEMLALIERSVELNGLFGSRHALGVTCGEGAIGDGKIGKKTRLKAEIADVACDFKAAPANLDRLRPIAY